MVETTNKHRRNVEFEVGDSVFLKIWPHRQTSLKPTIHAKLTAIITVHSIIQKVGKVGKVAYRLKFTL